MTENEVVEKAMQYMQHHNISYLRQYAVCKEDTARISNLVFLLGLSEVPDVLWGVYFQLEPFEEDTTLSRNHFTVFVDDKTQKYYTKA